MKITSAFQSCLFKGNTCCDAPSSGSCGHSVWLGSVQDYVTAPPLKLVISLASTSVKGHKSLLCSLDFCRSPPSRSFCCTRVGQQGVNTLSCAPSLADRLLFVGLLFAEFSDTKRWSCCCRLYITARKKAQQREDFICDFATAAVINPTAVIDTADVSCGCYTSLPPQKFEA